MQNLKNFKRNIYVIHKHFAKRLHYDLRLEDDGVLKSWAIPKKPPKQDGIKRLAVKVNDHNIEYADFEGEIPKGSYGAGKVEIWDKGSYETVKKTEKEWIIRIKGKKLKGIYCLIRIDEIGKNWIFFKKKQKEGVK